MATNNQHNMDHGVGKSSRRTSDAPHSFFAILQSPIDYLMESSRVIDSDDDGSLPDVQISAVTEALFVREDEEQAQATNGKGAAPDADQRGHTDPLVRRFMRAASQRRQASATGSASTYPRTDKPDDGERSRLGSIKARPKRFPGRAVHEFTASEPGSGATTGVTERSHLTSSGATASTSLTIHEQGSARDEGFSGSPEPSLARCNLSRDGVEEAEGPAPEYPRRVSIKSKAPHTSPERGHHLVSEHETKLAYDDRGRSSDVMPQEHLALAAPRNVPRPAQSSIEPAASAPLVVVPVTLEPATSEPEKRRIVKRFRVNAHLYSVTRKLGKGGSGRVYEVLSGLKELWAFKVIPLQNLDDRSKKQIQNEVSLLRDLRSVDRVIYLHDWVVEESKKTLFMVMELGECDLDNILRDKMDHQPQLDTVFVGYYWLEMLRCVAAIHDVGVVHSDLKPANFILASGKLKIADFGIANALPDDTVHVYQEQAAGTPNYMAPGTLRAMSRTGTSSLDARAFRFGKPSDMWSLGCILYLLVYGRQPFGHIQGLGPKAMAIINPSHRIEFAAQGAGGVRVPSGYLRTMKACLSREPSERPVAEALLRNADGLTLPEDAKNTVYVTARRLETMLGEAVGDSGAWASSEEVQSWAAKIMDNLEERS